MQLLVLLVLLVPLAGQRGQQQQPPPPPPPPQQQQQQRPTPAVSAHRKGQTSTKGRLPENLPENTVPFFSRPRWQRPSRNRRPRLASAVRR